MQTGNPNNWKIWKDIDVHNETAIGGAYTVSTQNS